MTWIRWGVLFLAVAVPCVAQAPVAQAPSPDSIFFGRYGTISLYLGQPKDAALRGLRSDYDLDVAESNSPRLFTVTAKGDPKTLYGTVRFKDDRLLNVWKVWTVNMPDDRGIDVMRTILAAMSAFGRSAQGCSVATDDRKAPAVEFNSVTITCGKHHVSIGTTRWLAGNSWREAVDVSESLGEPHAPRE